MKLTDLPKLGPGWHAALERARLREEVRRARWERHHKQEMTYDEFVFREGLQREVEENRMTPERAREALKKYYARKHQ